MIIEKVDIYIRYEVAPRSQYESLLLIQQQLQLSESKRWAIIFKGRNWCIELELDIDANRTIGASIDKLSSIEFSAKKKDFDFLATYHGSIQDIKSVVKNHKMNGSTYMIFKNNCQHYAAMTLRELYSLQSVRRGGRKMWKFTTRYYKIIAKRSDEKYR